MKVYLMNIKNVFIAKDGLEIEFQNGTKDTFPFLWLRDHCKDEENWDDRSNQRKVFTALLDPKISISHVKIVESKKQLEAKWPDMDNSVLYSGEFLFNNSLTKHLLKSSQLVWDKKDISKYSIDIEYDSLKQKKGFQKLLQVIKTHGFSVINNCPKDIKSVEFIANKIGYVRNSIFGGLWSFESNSDMADSAYTQEELRPHTDGTYNNDAPGLQLLLCCDYDAEGGESIMVDGFKIAELINKSEKDVFNVLSEVEIPGRYFGDGVELIAKRPVFRLNKENEITQVSFNNYDRADFRLPNNEINRFYSSISTFDKLANDKSMQWRKILKPGQLLIFNNWRILHGRSEFKGKRRMSGCYVNKEDFESACMMHSVN